jgi:gamma-glutamyl:cysteine ligase YbdK (ATP-grasp superfamily)
MGQTVDRARFEQRDFARFRRALDAETELLHDWVEAGRLSDHEPMAGLELEAWLVDAQGRPAPRNDEFIERFGSPEVVTEIGRFNVEFNVAPQPVRGRGLARLAANLHAAWAHAREVAASMGLHVVAVGILPSLAEADLRLANLSDRGRYRALNQQVLRQRRGRCARVDIEGCDGARLHLEHPDVMLEAAATSFQVHLQMPSQLAARAHNAAMIASAPLLAAACNSPLLFGLPLWQETRIPVFEQALGIGAREDGAHGALPRVGFGSAYIGFSMVEAFRENAARFEPLLPVAIDEPAQRLAHLRLHNGTIWRWTRPVVGFDAEDGRVHLRTEIRPLPAGPTLPDMVANLAFTVGLVAAWASDPVPPEWRLPFEQARANFYAAARDGIDARLVDLDGRERSVTDWLSGLLPRAGEGLAALGVDALLADAWLETIGRRLERRLTGARWQADRLRALGGDVRALTLEIAALQGDAVPLHEGPPPGAPAPR